MRVLRLARRLPLVGPAYAAVIAGAYAWWALQAPSSRTAVLAGSSTNLAHLTHQPWLVLPLSSIWSGGPVVYWILVALICLGALERIAGRVVTVITGIVAHVIGTLVSEGITAARIAGGELGEQARHLVDFGPSYIIAACAAAVVASPKAPRFARIACALTIVPLVVMAFADLTNAGQVATIGHAVALLVGVLVARLHLPRRIKAQLASAALMARPGV